MATSATCRVILVRPWLDAQSGSGCCSGGGREAIELSDHEPGPVEHSHATRTLAGAYARLTRELPDVDVQIVSSSNTVYLIPSVLRAAARGEGWRASLRRANLATRPGSLLVDGVYAGDVVELGPSGVVEAVRQRL